MKKHIDNHLNPHSNKGRRTTNNNNNVPNIVNATNLSNTIAAVASGAAADMLATNFLAMDNKINNNSLSPRMTPIVKHELYFPQCYGPPFNQAFPGAVGVPLIQDGGSVAGSEGGNVNINNSGESSPTGMLSNGSDAGGAAVTR